MKTLADLKRDLTIGRKLRMVRFYESETEGRLLNVPREVVAVQSNGVWLSLPPEMRRSLDRSPRSYLDFPKAKDLEYDGRTFRIFADDAIPVLAPGQSSTSVFRRGECMAYEFLD
jgi:hypothetical protein